MCNQMFCFQCQETMKGTGCTIAGVCGKQPITASLQDLLVYTVKGVAAYSSQLRKIISIDEILKTTDRYIINSLFMTITNANFDNKAIINEIKQGLKLRNELKNILIKNSITLNPRFENIQLTTWTYLSDEELIEFSKNHSIGILRTENEDIRSLRELLTYGLKGMAAYAEHAMNLNKTNEEIFTFMEKALLATLDDTLSGDDLTALVLECGAFGVKTMALLDEANTSAFGNPEITKVNIGVGNRPGILISGHDLNDLEQLLEQSKDSGVDIYTHSEMLPGHYYPKFKKYSHFFGNYGNAWWKQKEEFESFHGPILMTTNCIVPPKDTYKDRLYTTGAAGFPGCQHIDDIPEKNKDFSKLIEQAKHCAPPLEIERGEIIGGFAHAQVFALADQVVSAVKSGAIRKFVVMAGCDGRAKSRSYYTDFAKALPKDTVILTAGCAKYKYNKLNLGDINGIPRVLDAGQCNDSYSLAVIALKLKEIFELNDINELPIIYNIAWYEQKAVIVLLALLSLGVKNIHLGPTLPAFLSPNVTKLLIENFQISGIDTVEHDMRLFFGE